MWFFRLWRNPSLRLSDGRAVTVLDPGRLNRDAGPDFFNAKIIIDNVEWAGNVELHVKASDWNRHNHSGNLAYDNIILHVVMEDDCEIHRADGSVIPQLQVDMGDDVVACYNQLSSACTSPRCGSYLKDLPEIMLADWLETLGVERMQVKGRRITDVVDRSAGDWQQAAFITFARALGFGLNSEPFELLAKQLPLKLVARHSDSVFQLEAMLFGISGMLDSSRNIFDDYYQQLCRESYFLMKKYGLKPIPHHLWKYSRTRPANFPHRRIALLARYLYGGCRLVDRILDADGDIGKLEAVFSEKLDGYWTNHVSFGMESNCGPTELSKSSVSLLMINFVAPFYYAYGNVKGDIATEEACFRLLMELPPENNHITRTWASSGIKARDAMQSQALIHLRNEYCDCRECLRCRIGYRVLMNPVTDTAK